MNSLDTNVVLRFLLNDEPSKTAVARRLLSRPPIYVSDVVFTEAAFVLEKAIKMDRAAVAMLLRTLLAVPGLICNDLVLPDVIDLFESRKKLSFVDCYAAVEAKIFGANLYTFDRKLLSQGGSHVRTP